MAPAPANTVLMGGGVPEKAPLALLVVHLE